MITKKLGVCAVPGSLVMLSPLPSSGYSTSNIKPSSAMDLVSLIMELERVLEQHEDHPITADSSTTTDNNKKTAAPMERGYLMKHMRSSSTSSIKTEGKDSLRSTHPEAFDITHQYVLLQQIWKF